MGQVMPQPFKHPKTGVYYYRKVVPAPLRESLGKTEFRISLGTKDLREAKRLYLDRAVEVDALLSQAAGGPVSLTHQQIVALAGVWYTRELAAHDAEPGEASGELEPWDLVFHQTQDAEERGRLLDHITADVDALLKAEGLTINRASWERLADRVFWNKVRLCNTLNSRASGDYSSDKFTRTFPEWKRPDPATARATAKPSSGPGFADLMSAWELDRQPPQRTLYEWRRVKSMGSKRPGAPWSALR